MVVAQKGAASDFRKETLRVMAKMLGQRFVYPSLETAVGELKVTFDEFEKGIDGSRPDKEALLILEAVADQTRGVSERETGKQLAPKLAAAYRAIAELRASL